MKDRVEAISLRGEMAVSVEHHIKRTQTTIPCILNIVIASLMKSIITVKRILQERKDFSSTPTHL